jgi:hypothetical protein
MMAKSNKATRSSVRAGQSGWKLNEEKAIRRLIAAWEKYQGGGDPDKLEAALDALTVAHVAATFEWASGPLKW